MESLYNNQKDPTTFFFIIKAANFFMIVDLHDMAS